MPYSLFSAAACINNKKHWLSWNLKKNKKAK